MSAKHAETQLELIQGKITRVSLQLHLGKRCCNLGILNNDFIVFSREHKFLQSLMGKFGNLGDTAGRGGNIRMFLPRISFNRRNLGVWQLSGLYPQPPSPRPISMTMLNFSSCH